MWQEEPRHEAGYNREQLTKFLFRLKILTPRRFFGCCDAFGVAVDSRLSVGSDTHRDTAPLWKNYSINLLHRNLPPIYIILTCFTRYIWRPAAKPKALSNVQTLQNSVLAWILINSYGCSVNASTYRLVGVPEVYHMARPSNWWFPMRN